MQYQNGMIVFAKTFSAGESGHKHYNGRRTWRVYSLVNKEADVKPDYDNYWDSYPFQISADRLIDIRDLAIIHRDYL